MNYQSIVDSETWLSSEISNFKEAKDVSIIEIDNFNFEMEKCRQKKSSLYNNLFYKSILESNTLKNNYKVAFSFDGSNRDYVENVATELANKIGKENLFYDDFYEAELARLDLDIFLQEIYSEKSEFIVTFLSNEYKEKEWCGVEWRSIRELIKKRKGDKVILVKLDDSSFDGLYSLDGYLDGSKHNAEKIADLIYQRIQM